VANAPIILFTLIVAISAWVVALGLTLLNLNNGDPRNYYKITKCDETARGNALRASMGTSHHLLPRYPNIFPYQEAVIHWFLNEDERNVCVDDEPVAVFQRYALANIYFAMNGPNWTTFSSSDRINVTHFLSPSSECNWEGVTCEDGLITQLNLESRNRMGKGYLATEISLLPKLESINLASNRLVGDISPELFYYLNHLSSLDLSSNLLTGTISDQIVNLQNLTQLVLCNNTLQGHLPVIMGEMELLKHVRLDRNLFEGTIPEAFLNLPNLDVLSFYDNLFVNAVSNEACPASRQGKERFILGDCACGYMECSCCTTCFPGRGECPQRPPSFECRESTTRALTQSGISIFDHTSVFNELIKISDINLLSDLTGEAAQRKALVWIKTTETTLSMNQILQRYALAVFYFSTGGDKWTQCSTQSSLCRLRDVSSNHFLSDDDECTWGGIACDSTGNVIGINIDYNGLSGAIPFRELSTLCSLKHLSIRGNSLIKMGDTDWIKHCANLEFLDVSQNSLFGGFPVYGLSQLNNLRTLDISDNRMYGLIYELPENIRVARMHNNLFSFPLDTLFRAHAPIHLEELTLHGNDVKGSASRSTCSLLYKNGGLLQIFSTDCVSAQNDGELDCSCCTICMQ